MQKSLLFAGFMPARQFIPIDRASVTYIRNSANLQRQSYRRFSARPSVNANRSANDRNPSPKDYVHDRNGIPIGRILSEEETPEYLKAEIRNTYRRLRILKRLVKGVVFGFVFGVPFLLYVYFREKEDKKIFNPPRFTPFTLIKREIVSPSSIILTLRPKSELLKKDVSDPYKESWEKGPWSVEVKQPELQIARPYTPLPPAESDNRSDLRFLIRKEHKGEVSGYLHALPVGSKLELRGPKLEFYLPQEITDVVFLAGGTGIAPAMQVAYTLLERRPGDVKMPRIRIVWANRRREDCENGTSSKNDPNSNGRTGHIVRELQNLQLKHPDNFSVEYLVDEEGTYLDQRRVAELTKKTGSEAKFGSVALRGAIATRIDSKLLFISGPEGLVNFLAGPKRWEGGKEGQGEVGGILGRLWLRDWKVWKF
jgi:cytochrome-b5 reductase